MAKRRSKKELAQAVALYHQRILDRLKIDENVAIRQYKSLYFAIFRDAYEKGFCMPLSYNQRMQDDGFIYEWIYTKPYVTGDSIWTYAKECGWVHSEMTGTEQRYRNIEIVRNWWEEWTYAWRQLMHRTRRHRTIEKVVERKP